VDNGATIWAIGVDITQQATKVYLDYAQADNDDAQNINVSSSYAGHGTGGVQLWAQGTRRAAPRWACINLKK
jgi:hypothetical protein